MLLFTALVSSARLLHGVQLNMPNCGVNLLLEKTKNVPHYIIGGDITKGPAMWPWVCSVGTGPTEPWEHSCGGTLITYGHVLTAAHCTRDFRGWGKDDQIKVRCGDFDLSTSTDDENIQIGDVKSYEDQDKYKPHLINFDITILTLEVSLQPTSFVRPICLTREETSDTVTVLGWGLDESGQVGVEMKKSLQQIFSSNRCATDVGKHFWIEGGFGDDLFCAADPTGKQTGSCSGDSGGPIFGFDSDNLNYELRGIVNGGLQCGQFNTPDIYTSTIYPEIYNWIRKVIECSDGKLCLPRHQCPFVENKYRIIEDESRDSAVKKEAIVHLKSLVCDNRERLFCCNSEKTDLLFLGAKTVHLPSFTEITRCTTPTHPVERLKYAITGLFNGGGILTCGGRDAEFEPLSSCHSLKGPEWTKEPNMIEKRSGAASCQTPKGIFVTGGDKGQPRQRKYLSSTEYFSGKWTKGPDMPVAMAGHCQVYTSSAVIVTGGGGVSNILSTVLMLEVNTWTTLPSMNQARTSHSCEYYRGQVVVMGGRRDASNSIEVLNIDRLKWTGGPSLPRKVFFGLSTIFADVLYLVNQDGVVVSIGGGNYDEWQEVGNIGIMKDMEVLTAKIVTPAVIGC